MGERPCCDLTVHGKEGLAGLVFTVLIIIITSGLLHAGNVLSSFQTMLVCSTEIP